MFPTMSAVFASGQEVPWSVFFGVAFAWNGSKGARVRCTGRYQGARHGCARYPRHLPDQRLPTRAPGWSPRRQIRVYSDVNVQGSVLEPRKLEASEAAVKATIKLPQGFSLTVFARELVNPRVLAVSEQGHVYVSRRAENDVLLLKDTDGDGRADEKISVAARPGLHGIAITGSTMFLVANKDLYKAEIQEDGRLGELTRLIKDLPDAGQHRNRTIGIGPDGMLYVSVGSTCNECEESNPENAAILRISKDGKMRTIFASGLRNTIGFAWHPSTGELFGMDHGIDWLGDNEQFEEFNHIQQGRQYGWPFIYDNGRVTPQSNPPGAMTPETWREISENPVLTYTAHSAPMQMLFYTGGQFPAEYQGDDIHRHAWVLEPATAERLRSRAYTVQGRQAGAVRALHSRFSGAGQGGLRLPRPPLRPCTDEGWIASRR